MDSARFENANKLWLDGHKEEAAREFHAMAEEEADDPDGKAALLMNELNCYLQISELDKANEVMRQIRALPVRDEFVRLIGDFGRLHDNTDGQQTRRGGIEI
jgi:hypothetical protein